MPRIRFLSPFMLAAALFVAASPAAACLPPPEGYQPPTPTREEVVRTVVNFATDIVSGRVIGRTSRDGRIRFLVEHVYKGKLRPGAILAGWEAWGMDAPMCAGMIPPPAARKGTRGTIFFNGRPEIAFIDDADMERAFAMGLLQRRPKRPSRR